MPGDWFGGWPGGCWACIGIGCFPQPRRVSATYLGGRSLAEFAATGRVTEHSPGALLTTTAAMTWPTAPTSIEIF